MNAPGPVGGGDDRPPWRRLKPIQVGFVLALFAFVLWRHPFDDRGEAASPWTLRGQALGTSWTVRWLPPGTRDAPETPRVQATIEAALDRVDGLMSTWKPDSELMRLNRAPLGEAFAITAETAAVLQVAADVSARSGGAFDVTVGPLVRAWGFGAGAAGEHGEAVPVPAPQALEAAAAAVGWQKLALDPAGPTATRTAAGLQVDLSAIAKGFAVDEVARGLAGIGLEDFFVEVGGEVVARGTRADGTPWKLGIETPAAGTAPGALPPQHVVALSDAALATSGDYRSFREVGGERFSHTIDPRTRRPIAHGLASVSVVGRDCVHADAWATALHVLGPDEGMAVAEREGLAALFVVRRDARGFDVRMSSVFADKHGAAGKRATSEPQSGEASPPATEATAKPDQAQETP